MDMQTAFLSSILDSEFYEPIESNQPGPELAAVVLAHASEADGWRMSIGGYWTHVAPESGENLVQGWKIHLSASQATAKMLLERVVPIVVRHRMAFKFLSDLNVVRLSLNKNSPRTAAGKFITIYPDSLDSFKTVIEQLHQATEGCRGPFLLTDRPYKDSRVVYYRYGEHLGAGKVDIHGARKSGIQDPDGNWISDERRAFFYLPDWLEDPFDGWAPVEPPKDGVVLLHERYRVDTALRFHGTGAVYSGIDTHTGNEVIIREARPIHRDGDHGEEEGFLMLEKEARILQKLGPKGVCPQFVELFQEWEHLFLVQERLDADTLWGYSMNITQGSVDLRPVDVFEGMKSMFLKIAQALQEAHREGIVLRDITRNNVMVNRKTEAVHFIDFEFSYELDRDDPPVAGYTEGYSSPEQLRVEIPHPGEDIYSLGALILDMLAFTAPGLRLNRQGILDAFKMTVEDYHLPPEVYETIAGALEVNRHERWDIPRMIEHIESATPPTLDVPVVPTGDRPPERPAPQPALLDEIDTTLKGLVDFNHHHMTPDRRSRLWPGSPDIYETNPLQLAYGAAGTAVFMHRAAGAVPAEAVTWMADHLDVERTPPGLFTGLAGIALAFLEIGQETLAREAMDAANESPIRMQRAELRAGASGWGLANLHFYQRLGDETYLRHAQEAGDYLLATSKSNAQGRYWEIDAGIPLGYGHGQSGPATFLLFLDALCPGQGFLETAIAAIDFEIAHRQPIADELLWFPHVGASGGAPKSPHMRHGSAGVGTAALRGWAATGEDRLLKLAEKCSISVACRHTNKLWHDYGLAGYGEYLLDLYDFTGDENYRHNAFFIAEALMPYRIHRPEGIAFPAEELLRITTDFSAGTAGIGIFLHRLIRPEARRFLLLDELLSAPSAAKADHQLDAVAVA